MAASEPARHHHLDSPRLGVVSLAVLGTAALVAILVVVLRSDGAGELGSLPSVDTAGLRVRIALPGLGAGAPSSLDDVRLITNGGGVTRVELTAQRYARHLAGDILRAPTAATAPLQSADQVQVALTVASKPALYRETEEVDSGPVSATVLASRLGLEADEPLPPFFTYTIQRGDTVTKLANRFGLQAESILFNNFELRDPDRLPVGGQLTIPTQDGVVYTVLLGDTLFEIAENFAADVDDILAFEGNELASPDQLIEGRTILLVGGAASATFGGIGAGPVFAIPDFRWPMGGVLSDFFGTPRGNRFGFHTGIDLSNATGTFIGATAPGTVVQAGWDGSFGLSVLVDHGGGVVSRYAHLNHIDVFLGEWVEAGSLIGFLGQTGLATGPHLHFEIIMGGTPVDPLIWLNS